MSCCPPAIQNGARIRLAIAGQRRNLMGSRGGNVVDTQDAYQVFLPGLPALEMRTENDLFVIGPGPAGKYMHMPISAAREAYARLGRVLAAYDSKPDPVVPLCELCVQRRDTGSPFLRERHD